MYIRKKTWTKKDGKQSTRYYVVWVDEYDKRREEPAGTTRKAAENLRVRLEREKAAGTLGKPKPDNPRLYEYYDTWMEAKKAALKPSSAVSYEHTFRNLIIPALGKKRLDDIRPRDIQAWINDLGSKTRISKEKELKQLSPATVGRAYRYLRSCLRHALTTGETHNDPCRGIILPRIPREELDYLKPSEISALLERAPEPERSLFAVLAYSGLRLGEALALSWKDIDVEMKAIRVEKAYSYHGGIQEPKTASSRRAVPMLPILSEILEARRGKPDELCFTKGTKPLDPSNVRRVFDMALEQAEIHQVTMHSLRHSYATVMIASGASIKALQRALGHATVSMTLNTYSHLLEESMETPALKADAMLRGMKAGRVVSLKSGKSERK